MTRRAAWLALALPLAACKVGPNYRQPSPLAGGRPAPAFIETREAAVTPGPLPENWWRLYDDPLLNAMIARALARNTDLRAALADLQQAQAVLREAQAERTPQTMFTGSVTASQVSADDIGSPVVPAPTPFYVLSEAVSYDLDLFGRLRRAVEEARASIAAQRAALDLARINVAAETAQAYVDLCSAGLRLDVTTRSLAVSQRTLGVIERRYAAGIDAITDVVRARTLVRQTAAELPSLRAQQRQSLYLLATLEGDPPEDLPEAAQSCATPPLLRRPLPVGNGAALIARRPDVREAEATLHARIAEIGVDTAALFPTITLGGSIGTEATRARDIVGARGFTWNVGPMVSWTFPNILATRAQIQAAGAEARASLARFDGTVLTALRESETAMQTLARALDTEDDLRGARDDAERASSDLNRLYAGGVGNFIDILDAERTAIAAEDSLAEATATVAQDQVSLFLALGGGWEDAPPVVGVNLNDATVTR